MAKATRAAFGETLVELVAEGIDVVAVEADLSKSTTTDKLGKVHPERLYNAGIAEQNMTGVAAGLSLAGKVAFTGSFAIFGTGRAYEQVRNTVAYNNLNVKIAPTHSGVTVGPDGGSHQMLEDIALMRILPNMRVLVPADYRSAKAAIRLAALTPGPFYVRLGRAEVPDIYPEGFELELGHAYTLREGGSVTIVAAGIEVGYALEAAEILAGEGIEAEVIDAVCVKPLDVGTIEASVAKTGHLVTAEEHMRAGGLGAAVLEALSANPVPTEMVAVNDRFGTSGNPDELVAYYGLGAADIAAAVRKVLG